MRSSIFPRICFRLIQTCGVLGVFQKRFVCFAPRNQIFLLLYFFSVLELVSLLVAGLSISVSGSFSTVNQPSHSAASKGLSQEAHEVVSPRGNYAAVVMTTAKKSKHSSGQLSSAMERRVALVRAQTAQALSGQPKESAFKAKNSCRNRYQPAKNLTIQELSSSKVEALHRTSTEKDQQRLKGCLH